MKKLLAVFAFVIKIVAFQLIVFLFLSSLQSEAFAQTIKIQHIVFDDDWRNVWSDASEKCKVNPKYDQWILNGTYALSATIEKGGALIFKREIPLDTKIYTGIAGFINGGSGGKQIIGVCVIDHTGARLPNNLGLDVRKYTQGGCIPVDDWKAFAIPFSHFGQLPKGIKGICFVNASEENAAPIMLDDFGLVDFAISSKASANSRKASPRTQPKNREITYIFSDKFENGWQDWSWQSESTLWDKSSSGGKMSLIVYQQANGAIAFGRPSKTPFRTKGYEALEFCLNGGDSNKQKLILILYDASGKEIRRGVSINDKDYIEDGTLSINAWKRVRIPLSRLRATDISIGKIALLNNTSEEQAFLIDEVMFVK